MSVIVKSYLYLFYKFYKLSEAAPSRWMSEWKACLAIDVLCLFTISSIINYYKVFVNPSSHIGEGNLLIIFIVVIGFLNYLILIQNDKWKKIIKEFDLLPRKVNSRGSGLVFITVLLLILNFIFSFILYYQK